MAHPREVAALASEAGLPHFRAPKTRVTTKRVAILGPTAHTFPRILAAGLVERGFDPVFVHSSITEDGFLPEGWPVLSSLAGVSSEERDYAELLRQRILAFEHKAIFPNAREGLSTLEAFSSRESPGSVSIPGSRGRLVGRFLTRLAPRWVFANHVFDNGYAATQTRGVLGIVMPWGGDIYEYGVATILTRRLLSRVFARADVIVPTSATSLPFMAATYGAPQSKMRAISWGIEADRFTQADAPERKRIRSRFRIPTDCRVVFNTRRFKPAWGSDQALDVMIEMSRRHLDTHYVIIGGGSNDPYMADAEERINNAGLSERFLLFHGDIPYATFASLARLADVGLSLKTSPDMRTASILEVAHAGAYNSCLRLA